MEQNIISVYKQTSGSLSNTMTRGRQGFASQSPNLPNLRQTMVPPQEKVTGLHVSNSAYNIDSPAEDNAKYFGQSLNSKERTISVVVGSQKNIPMFTLPPQSRVSNVSSVRLNEEKQSISRNFGPRIDLSAVNDDGDFMSRGNSDDIEGEPTESQQTSSQMSSSGDECFPDEEGENDKEIEIESGQKEVVEQKETFKSPEDELKRMELGGILVYDSYARILGNNRISEYQKQNPVAPINRYSIFEKSEVERLTPLFNPEARERDFQNEIDKQLYQRIQKFDQNQSFKAPQYTATVPNLHNMLLFDSRFESGNLRKASKVNNIEYNLWLENDVNTKGHTQWYFFKVVYKADKPCKIQFNILNLAKTYSLYKAGMKPVVFSKRKFEQQTKVPEQGQFWAQKHGWYRSCENIKYEQNDIPRYNRANDKFVANLNNDKFLYKNNGHGEGVENYYTLSFEYQFEHTDDEVWFAHAVPYTYTDLSNQLVAIQQNENLQSIITQEILCKTISGIPVPLLTITEDVQTYLTAEERFKLQFKLNGVLKKAFKQKYVQARKLLKQMQESKGKVANLLEAAFEEEIRSFIDSHSDNFMQASNSFQDFSSRMVIYMRDHAHKKAIVLTSRVHPGEPQASFMLEGSLQFILGDTELAKELRKHFVFLVVPMLNPDGVIHGNYRCSLLGCDLNRKWMTPNKFLHPPIYHTKQLIRYLQWERKVTLYCDMHGHSRKQNAFFFGCSYKNYEQEGRIKNAQLRIIPLLCCHKLPTFSFAGCNFRIERCKESTGRVVVFREFNIMNSFTLECSFHGENVGPESQSVRHLTVQDMVNVGEQLISVLENYLPREQQRLNMIGGKVLELFYDEFIKFVPAYILKREEEQKEQQVMNSPSQQMVIPQPRINDPRRQINPRKTIVERQISKPLVTKKPTAKDGVVTEHSDTEGFSQIIQFNEMQHKEEELFEFENFVQLQVKKSQSEAQAQESSSDEEKYIQNIIKNKDFKNKKKKKKPIPLDPKNVDLKPIQVRTTQNGGTSQTNYVLYKREQPRSNTNKIVYEQKTSHNNTLYPMGNQQPDNSLYPQVVVSSPKSPISKRTTVENFPIPASQPHTLKPIHSKFRRVEEFRQSGIYEQFDPEVSDNQLSAPVQSVHRQHIELRRLNKHLDLQPALQDNRQASISKSFRARKESSNQSDRDSKQQNIRKMISIDRGEQDSQERGQSKPNLSRGPIDVRVEGKSFKQGGKAVRPEPKSQQIVYSQNNQMHVVNKPIFTSTTPQVKGQIPAIRNKKTSQKANQQMSDCVQIPSRQINSLQQQYQQQWQIQNPVRVTNLADDQNSFKNNYQQQKPLVQHTQQIPCQDVSRKVNLQKLINQIKYGLGGVILDEKALLAYRKKSMIELGQTNIVGVGLDIRGRPNQQADVTPVKGREKSRDRHMQYTSQGVEKHPSPLNTNQEINNQVSSGNPKRSNRKSIKQRYIGDRVENLSNALSPDIRSKQIVVAAQQKKNTQSALKSHLKTKKPHVQQVPFHIEQILPQVVLQSNQATRIRDGEKKYIYATRMSQEFTSPKLTMQYEEAKHQQRFPNRQILGDNRTNSDSVELETVQLVPVGGGLINRRRVQSKSKSQSDVDKR